MPEPFDAPDLVGYLDHAASAPVRPEVVEAMLPFMTTSFANPSGAHLLARRARRVIDEAREELAELLGAQPGEVVFTSGGTESDNMAVFGASEARSGALVCSAVEHQAVLDPVLSLGGALVPVGADGVVDLDALGHQLDRPGGASVVSVMAVNNEVGAVQPVHEVAKLVKESEPVGALLHVDAVQAFTWLDVSAVVEPADLVSVSGHKIGGPKGVGALVVRRGVELSPRQLGGGQERGRRSGTQNVAGIVGMAVAARMAAAERAEVVARVERLRDRLAAGLVESVPGLVETAPDRYRTVPGFCHVCVEGVESEALLFLLEDRGVYASAASSCSSGAMGASHVLEAMGVSPGLMAGALRLSFGWASSEADVDRVLEALPPVVERLRAHAPAGPE